MMLMLCYLDLCSFYWKIVRILLFFNNFRVHLQNLWCCPTSPIRQKHTNIFGECWMCVLSFSCPLSGYRDSVLCLCSETFPLEESQGCFICHFCHAKLFPILGDSGTWDGDLSVSYLLNKGVGKESLLGDGFAMIAILLHVFSFLSSLFWPSNVKLRSHSLFFSPTLALHQATILDFYLNSQAVEAWTFFLHVLLWKSI